MERLRFRELVSVPSLLSLVRAPLAVAFPFVAEQPAAALTVVAAAALSDLLDGWSARRLGRATTMGAVLDPVMDKLFVLTVVVTLVVTRRLPLSGALLLGSRDVLQAPLLVWFAFNPRVLANRADRLKANVFGKLVTVLQFGTIGAALLAMKYVELFALASGLWGAVAAASYWARFLGRDGSVPPNRRQVPVPQGPQALTPKKTS